MCVTNTNIVTANMLAAAVRNGENRQWCTKLLMTQVTCFRDDIPKLEYLTMCIKEGMRLHCPVPIVNRHLSKELNIGDRVLPKGTAIQVGTCIIIISFITWQIYYGRFDFFSHPSVFQKLISSLNLTVHILSKMFISSFFSVLSDKYL